MVRFTGSKLKSEPQNFEVWFRFVKSFFKTDRSTQKLTTGRTHYSTFDLPEADPPEADLLASGELDVRCLQSAGGFISFLFDLTGRARPAAALNL